MSKENENIQTESHAPLSGVRASKDQRINEIKSLIESGRVKIWQGGLIKKGDYIIGCDLSSRESNDYSVTRYLP